MKLHDYQEKQVARAIRAPARRWIFNDETGLGKSGQALVAAQRLGANNCIIVCPANVRGNWVREIAKWWPDHPPVGVIWGSSTRKSVSKRRAAELAAAYAAPIRIVSYSLLARLLEAGASVADVIIFDECHLLQGAGSGWVAMARKLVGLCPGAAVFGLTATLMPNRPLDLWTVVDVVWPARFGEGKGGKFNWKFAQRYTQATHNGYGWAYKGAAEDTAEELKYRVRALSSRTTKQEVAHLLPPFMVRSLWADPGADTYAETLAWLGQTVDEVPHVCILTHLRDTAHQIANRIRMDGGYNDLPLLCITGADATQARDAKLEAHRQQPRGILVATVHSVGRGIDLTWCARALFAELYWRPETLVQGLGRFSRLSGTVPSSVDLLVIPGTVSERVAAVVLAKIEAITAVTEASDSEQKTVGALRLSDEDFLRALNTVTDSFTGEDLGADDADDS